MKIIKHNYRNILLAMLGIIGIVFTGCDKFVDFKDVIMMTGTEIDPLVKFTVEGTPSSFSVSATATGKVSENTNIDFAVDTTLVATYNKKMSANYYVLPAGSYDVSATSSVIAAGSHVSDPITIRITSIEKFVDGRTYILPVTIKNVSGDKPVLEASRTIYLKIARVIQFTSLDISNYNFYRSYAFAEPVNNITRYTFEIKCLVNSWHSGNPPISRLCNWGPVDESLPNLLRFGEAGSDTSQLQWVSAEGSAFSATRFAKNTWYTVSCVYDGSTYRMYVNGKLDASFEGAGKVYQLGALELGMSYSGYQNSQRFLGRIAEVRFWDRALGVTEIQEGICGVDAASPGLVGYWKMNEGEGQTFYDRTGHGRNMVWPNALGVWNTDATNKCAQ